MLWELIATFIAGVGATGVALALRKLSGGRLPRWLLPVAAGIGMLGFLIYSEYRWFAHQQTLLPAGIEVVREVQVTAAWRPWSQLWPQTLRFIAADVSNAERNQLNPALIRLHLYLVARHQPTQRIATVIDCQHQARADDHPGLILPTTDQPPGEGWMQLADDDDLLLLCEQVVTP